MQFRPLHSWDLSYREAVECQQRLAKLVRTDRPIDFSRLRTVAGADVAYEPRRSPSAESPGGPAVARFVAAVVVMSFPGLEVMETSVASAETSFPYIPGLLSFREGPALRDAFAGLSVRPDVVIFDGQGIAHPRGLGLAAHMGLLLDCPTVGCAKSALFGAWSGEPAARRGSRRALVAPRPGERAPGMRLAAGSPFEAGERVGTLLRTRDGVKPVWVSCGHLVDLGSAERLVLRTATRFRLPELIRSAHGLTNRRLREDAAESPSA